MLAYIFNGTVDDLSFNLTVFTHDDQMMPIWAQPMTLNTEQQLDVLGVIGNRLVEERERRIAAMAEWTAPFPEAAPGYCQFCNRKIMTNEEFVKCITCTDCHRLVPFDAVVEHTCIEKEYRLSTSQADTQVRSGVA